MNHLNDLVSRAQKGDADAFSDIVASFQDMAQQYARAYLKDSQLSQDATQEAFLRAFLDLPNLRTPKAFTSWFRRILFTRCNRFMRGKHYKIDLLDEEILLSKTLSPLEQLEAKENKILLIKAIQSLPDIERQVVTLFYFREHSLAKISALLGIPIHSVNNRLRRARKRLQKTLFSFHKYTHPLIFPQDTHRKIKSMTR